MIKIPSTITHAYFAIDIYDGLDEKIKNRLKNDQEYLKTFSEGPDILYFYNVLKLKGSLSIRNLGFYMHEHKTKMFFMNMIKYIKNNNLQNEDDVMSLLYGFIAHYVLDSTTHPFIIYKTGSFDINNKDTYKYLGLHNDMESYIDAYFMYTRGKKMPKYFKPHEFCFNVKEFSPSLKKVMDHTFKETFGEDNISDKYMKSLKQMKLLYRLLRYDTLGLKKFIYQIADKIIPYYIQKKEFISYHIDPWRKIHYLNLEKKEWNYPVDINERHDYSFIELYSIALKKALKIIEEVNKVLYEDYSIKILDHVFLNLSYSTGKNCNLKLKNQYFEF